MKSETRKLKVILTGATGLVGEGVLLECLANPAVETVLSVSRRPYACEHPKLQQCIVPDFMHLDAVSEQLTGYDCCFYCAGISSAGMSEADYTRITYDTAIAFAAQLLALNPAMVFCHVSGGMTDSSEQGRVMWARVKGKTENALLRMPFRAIYNFRPGLMQPAAGQRNVRSYYKLLSWIAPLVRLVAPGQVVSLAQLGRSMIHSVLYGYSKPVLEARDIQVLAEEMA